MFSILEFFETIWSDPFIQAVIWVLGSMIVILFLVWIIINIVANQKAHQRITEIVFNHKEAIDKLNKIVKKLEKETSSLSAEIKQINKEVATKEKRINDIDKVLMEPDKNLNDFKLKRELQEKKKRIQEQRFNFYQEQKERKEKLKNAKK